MKIGYIVGIDKDEKTGAEVYRAAIADIQLAKSESTTNWHWDFEFKMMTESDILTTLKKGAKWSNVGANNNFTALVGTTGALKRFTTGKNKPGVILSQIIDEVGIRGYRVATYNGKITTMRVKDIISYGERISREGGVPIQNAQFVPASGEKKAFFKAYEDGQFLLETITKSKNTYADVKKPNVEENGKALRSIKDIFTPEQIEQLTLGKKNGVNIKIYANPALTPGQMKILRVGLEDKVDVRVIARPEFSEDAMQLYADDLRDGLDIKRYLNPEYTIAQISELALGYMAGLDIAKYANPKISAQEMSEIRERLENGIWNSTDIKGAFVTA